MKFELTERLLEDILFSMENQQDTCFVDAETGMLIPITAKNTADFAADASGAAQTSDKRYYDIPSWNSVSGFRLMEQFCASLRNPPAKQALRDVLSEGKGVFRAFKDTLKNYPEVEKRWFVFKQSAMKQVVCDWYRNLCDVWHFEAAGVEIEDTADLVLDDFVFRKADEAPEIQSDVQHAESEMFDEIAAELSDFSAAGKQTGLIFARLWQEQKKICSAESFCAAVYTLSGEFAGFICAGCFPGCNPSVQFMTALFVKKKFRGLGLARMLVELLFKQLAASGTQRLLLVYAALPDSLRSFFLQCGFEIKGSALMADLK